MTKTTGKTVVDASILDCGMPIVSSTDYWDFYFCSIDDSPHSTLVNLSFFDIAPEASSLSTCFRSDFILSFDYAILLIHQVNTIR